MKKVKKIYRKFIEYIITNRLFISYVIIALLGTCLLRKITLGHVSSLYPLITDLGLILIIGSFGYFIKPKNQFKYFFAWICFLTILEVINSIYYVFYTNYASLGDLATLSQAKTVTGSIWEKLRITYLIYLLLPVIFYLIHNKLSRSSYYNFMDKTEKGKKMMLSTLAVGLIFIGLTFAFATNKDYSRLNKQWNRKYIVERFGLIMYQGNDIVQTLKPKLSSLFGKEDAIELFNNYFNDETRLKYNEKNKYTGILEGKNIVLVHMESMQTFLMDLKYNGGEVTPNLNALAKEGMFFSNFYPQVSTGTSSDTEFTLVSSLMPAASSTVFVSYYNRNYNTLPKYLKNEGYYTFSMHGNLSSMWNRNKAHPSLGYEGMYYEESYEYEKEDVINLGINDKLFFKQIIPIMEQIEENYSNYLGEVITLSNHSPFTYLDKYGEFDLSETFEHINEETGETETLTTNYIDGTPAGNYIHSVHYADEALGELINYIKESDHFNNTVFIFYGDHDAKLTRKELNYLYNHNPYDGELYEEDDEHYKAFDTIDYSISKKTPLIIWTKNNSLKNTFKGNVDYYMGMIDVGPTILNMLNMQNPYALGHDIFNIKDNNTIAFPDGSFLTDVMYYNNSTEEHKVIKLDAIIEEDYIATHKDYVEKLLDVSNSIIVYDLLSNKEEQGE